MLQEAEIRKNVHDDISDCIQHSRTGSVNEIFNSYLEKYDVCQVVQEYNRAGAAGIRRYMAGAGNDDDGKDGNGETIL